MKKGRPLPPEGRYPHRIAALSRVEEMGEERVLLKKEKECPAVEKGENPPDFCEK